MLEGAVEDGTAEIVSRYANRACFLYFNPVALDRQIEQCSLSDLRRPPIGEEVEFQVRFVQALRSRPPPCAAWCREGSRPIKAVAFFPWFQRFLEIGHVLSRTLRRPES